MLPAWKTEADVATMLARVPPGFGPHGVRVRVPTCVDDAADVISEAREAGRAAVVVTCGSREDWLRAASAGLSDSLVAAALLDGDTFYIPGGEGAGSSRPMVVAAGRYAPPGPGLAWEGRLRRLLRLRVAYEEASAMLSTLGGGHFLCRHLKEARALASAQQRLALAAGDSRQAVRCGVHHCYACMSAGDPAGAAAALVDAAALGVRLGVAGSAASLAACAAAAEDVRAMGWAQGGTLVAQGAGKKAGADASSSSSSSSRPDAPAPASPHPAAEHVALRLSGVDGAAPGDVLSVVSGAAGAEAPLTSPPEAELEGMLTSAGAYVVRVGRWLAESAAAGGGQGPAGWDDFSRQRPGEKLWRRPEPQLLE